MFCWMKTVIGSGRSSFEFRVASTEKVQDVILVVLQDLFCHLCCTNVKGNVSSDSNSRGKGLIWNISYLQQYKQMHIL